MYIPFTLNGSSLTLTDYTMALSYKLHHSGIMQGRRTMVVVDPASSPTSGGEVNPVPTPNVRSCGCAHRFLPSEHSSPGHREGENRSPAPKLKLLHSFSRLYSLNVGIARYDPQ
uniref:(California timema) hypothetical protein n=1 Tax=Timema californicum TaxID=61474 RepID=A0A7R9JHH1_TIMCA|nr:unnamed protein product [Timema californicum]